eukprot:TRINITY_DN75049_c0_g1_i1.p1 TRINITY_DN75049_c0_g1~~TRINITY_DN75049_c0_g1_i1.p1  ORF type:complete len:185 (+),score=12.39 TRINITY_DN75049_c0_g1_i1:118-672(+)
MTAIQFVGAALIVACVLADLGDQTRDISADQDVANRALATVHHGGICLLQTKTDIKSDTSHSIDLDRNAAGGVMSLLRAYAKETHDQPNFTSHADGMTAEITELPREVRPNNKTMVSDWRKEYPVATRTDTNVTSAIADGALFDASSTYHIAGVALLIAIISCVLLCFCYQRNNSNTQSSHAPN